MPKAVPDCVELLLRSHGRARPGHPRLACRRAARKTWMPATSAGMTAEIVEDHGSICCAQAISDPGLRQDVLRTFRIRLDLLPELSDINTKILWVREATPQFPQQKSVRQHLAGMLNEYAQELVFLRRQLDLLIADLDDAPYEINREIADTKNRTFSLNVKLVPKCGAHPRKEFIHAERLRHVVIGSEIECVDFHGLIATARQNHDRYAFVACADRPQQVEALDVRQSEIENNQIRLLRQQLQGRLAVGSLQNFIALRCQPHAQELADRALVIDHKDLGRSGHSCGRVQSLGLWG